VTAGVFPGSFDPLTVAHVAIADAARTRFELERIDLVISRIALAKESGGHSSLDERVAAIEAAAAAGRPWLAARVTDSKLIVDIAEGYDVCIVGADKWHQLHDPAFYGGSRAARDDALARLPLLAVVPRGRVEPPSPHGLVVLHIGADHADVSSTAVRDGRHEWRA
jgi:hypothetical protein